MERSTGRRNGVGFCIIPRAQRGKRYLSEQNRLSTETSRLTELLEQLFWRQITNAHENRIKKFGQDAPSYISETEEDDDNVFNAQSGFTAINTQPLKRGFSRAQSSSELSSP